MIYGISLKIGKNQRLGNIFLVKTKSNLNMLESPTWVIYAIWLLCYNNSLWFHNSDTSYWELKILALQILWDTKEWTSMIISWSSFKNYLDILNYQKNKNLTLPNSVLLSRIMRETQPTQQFNQIPKNFLISSLID